MTGLEKYSKEKLKQELADIRGSDRNTETPELTIYEKAIIYKYSQDGYEILNEKLRKSKGKNIDEFGKFLHKSLDKLPDFDGLVYRGANLNISELKRYRDAFDNNKTLKEYCFLSTSKSRLIAMAFNGNVLFRIYSGSGKEIEKIAKFGLHGTPNEKEVLFRANINFKILEITTEATYTLITMEET